jgi:hypothetical protein
MPLDQQLQAALAALAPAGGVYQDANPVELPVCPYIVWSTVVSPTTNTLDGATNMQNSRIQIDVRSLRAIERRELSDAVFAAMTADTAPFVAIERSAFNTFENDFKVFRRVIDFSVWSKD